VAALPATAARIGRWLAVTAVAAAALTAVAAVVGPPVRSGPAATVAVTLAPADVRSTMEDLAQAVRRTQRHLTQRPDDWPAWAALGAAYVQLARVSSDPAWYPRAEKALRRSLAIEPASANAIALTGLGALAAARHDFATALRLGTDAERVDPYSADTRGVVADSLIELGRYDEAYRAIQAMVDLRPDTGSYARASYAWELRGRVDLATADMTRALDVAPSAADVGFTRDHLAELAFGGGDVADADRNVKAGLAAAPGYRPLLVTDAKILAARGDLAGAVAVLRPVVAAVPVPAYAALLGDLLDAMGDHAGARAQEDLVEVEARLQAAQGVNVDLELVLCRADHGDAARALRDAEAGYAVRPTIAAADALAWALHVNGRDRRALTYADVALRLGTRDALMFYHRGMVEVALGQVGPARRDLAAALRINPSFSVRRAPLARAALARLAGGA
jgi:tetratricopeptide (TPR) repeat protein